MISKKLLPVFTMMLFLSPLVFSSCQSKQTSNKQPETSTYYTCSMHPQVHKDKPGNCPVCGMKLIKVSSSSRPKESLDTSLSYLTEPVTQTVVGSFKAIEPVKTNPADTVIAEGYIGFDERGVNTVSTRVAGRIENLYVNYTNQRIRKGQPLMDIYSPQLLSLQRDLLQTLQDNDTVLMAGLKKQLLNLGMQANEIQKVMQRRQPMVKTTIYSPCDGISRPVPSSSTAESGVPERPDIRQGMYVHMGQAVFNIRDISRTWAILHLFTRDLWHIRAGDAVSLYTDANPAHIIKGRVDFIPPYRSSDEKTSRIRVYLNHLPQRWKIGTLIHGQITTRGASNGIYIPLSALNRLGMHSIVWVQDKRHANVFHAGEVKTGIQTSDSIQIISGIQPGDRIAENAAYMVDSDSFIQ